jgi:cytidyltransferase-like protein
MKVVLVTGGFDPLHSGHISYFKEAKKLGDKLVVGLNSDEWLTRKKGKPFMPIKERVEIIKNLKMVDDVLTWDDSDDSASGAIFKLMATSGYNKDIIFANGGDRTSKNIPEMATWHDKIQFVFGVGGTDKLNSSSWILEEYKYPKTNRQWGYYRVLHEDGPTTKVKELTVDPGKSLSMQRHQKRSEYWLVTEGTATVYTINRASTDYELHGVYKKHQSLRIDEGEWHQLVNETDKPCKIVEIQYGENCVEEDIERK